MTTTASSRPTSSSPATPFDRVVARLLCDPAIARFVPAHGKPDKRADTAAPAAFKDGIRLVTFEWVREPKLWNWVRVIEPADARPEEVAASVFERGDGQSHTEQSYTLTAAPPYLTRPSERTRRVGSDAYCRNELDPSRSYRTIDVEKSIR